ncbi:MAG: hypothetical protein V8Q79_09190 [Christensenellales bacterium]
MTKQPVPNKKGNAVHTLLGWLKGYVLIAPAIILLCIFTIYPIFGRFSRACMTAVC